MSVGVTVGGMGVGSTGVSVLVIDTGTDNDGMGVKVGRISALKLQAASISEPITNDVKESNNLWFFIQTHFCLYKEIDDKGITLAPEFLFQRQRNIGDLSHQKV